MKIKWKNGKQSQHHCQRERKGKRGRETETERMKEKEENGQLEKTMERKTMERKADGGRWGDDEERKKPKDSIGG